MQVDGTIIASGFFGVVYAVLICVLCYFFVFANDTSITRFLTFVFFLNIPIGMALFNAGGAFISRKRNQGVPISDMSPILVPGAILSVFLSLACYGFKDTFFVPLLICISLFMNLYTEFKINAKDARTNPILFAILVFAVCFIYTTTSLDFFWARCDEYIFGNKWGNTTPTDFVEANKISAPVNNYPLYGIANGKSVFGLSNYRANNATTTIWTSPLLASIVLSICVLVICFAYEDRIKDLDTSNLSRIYSPKHNGLENIIRFFTAVQNEILLRSQALGFENTDLAEEFVVNGSVFVNNVGRYETLAIRNKKALLNEKSEGVFHGKRYT